MLAACLRQTRGSMRVGKEKMGWALPKMSERRLA